MESDIGQYRRWSRSALQQLASKTIPSADPVSGGPFLSPAPLIAAIYLWRQNSRRQASDPNLT